MLLSAFLLLAAGKLKGLSMSTKKVELYTLASSSVGLLGKPGF